MKNYSFRSVVILLITLFISSGLFAQMSVADQKAVEKSKALYAKKKFDKAISTISSVQNKYPFSQDLWDLRIVYENDRYEAEYNRILQSVIKQINAGKTNVKYDETKLNTYKLSMLFASVQATLFCEKAELASNLLDRFLVAPAVDTAIGDDAKKAYDAGDKEYNDQNWNAAIREYKKAVAIDSNYFNASYSIAIAYYKNGDYDKAVPWFRKCIRIEPKRTITYKSLADTYWELKQYDDMKNVLIDGILVYPDVAFFLGLEKVADKLDKKFNRHWQERLTYPNDVSSQQDAMSSTPWQYYREAKDKIADFCNDQGIIKRTSSITEQKYMETFSWEYMLKKSKEEDESDYKEMAFAREMQKEGYLDCYAFVSMYHFYVQKQYEDFSKNNADRIRRYINDYLMK